MSIYGKRFALEQHLLAQYENKTIKCVWFKRFGKKCFLASGQPTKNFTHMSYKTTISMTLDEMLKIVECLGKATRLPDSVNYFEISETTDWKGDCIRLVLKNSEYQGLMLCRLKACTADIEMIGSSDNKEEDRDSDHTESDPEPIAKIVDDEAITNLQWNECFEKFHISKKDKWDHFQTQLREFCVDVNKLLHVDQESRIPTSTVPPPTVPPPSQAPSSSIEQTQLTGASGDGKTKGISGSEPPKAKRKCPNNKQLFDNEVSADKNFELAVANLLYYMKKHDMVPATSG
jgi:hypothetical protein